jgi:hypothetical protein
MQTLIGTPDEEPSRPPVLFPSMTVQTAGLLGPQNLLLAPSPMWNVTASTAGSECHFLALYLPLAE